MVLLRARELGVSVFALMFYIGQHLTSSHYTHKGEFGITLIVTWTSEAKKIGNLCSGQDGQPSIDTCTCLYIDHNSRESKTGHQILKPRRIMEINVCMLYW